MTSTSAGGVNLERQDSGTSVMNSLEHLPDELVVLIPGQRPAQLCTLMCTCLRFRGLASDEALWQECHEQRWRYGRPTESPECGWRVDFRRRHRQDSAVLPLVQQLGDQAAWRQLMALGEQIADRVQALLRQTEVEGPTPRERAELVKVLRGLRQTEVRRSWEALYSRAEAAARSGETPPGVEEGALLLVAWNATEDELCRPGELELSVTAELDALAARLRARVRPEASVREVVTELSRLMCEEEGFAGNQLNYYDPNNSLLDHVLASRTGIPISLSVAFAAVAERAGVPLDMIGLPGHFLLGSRPTRPDEERIFIDPFHGGAILSLDDCAQIVAHYGVAWTADLANPVPHAEVWGRMVRNLLNCHKRNGDVDQVAMHEQLLPQPPPLPVPYPGGDGSGIAAEQACARSTQRTRAALDVRYGSARMHACVSYTPSTTRLVA